MRRRGRSLEDDRARLTGFTGTGVAGTCGRARGCAGGVTLVSTSRLPVVAEMSRTRWPPSPTARSCGCLHRGSNAQAVSKTGEAARSHVPMASASCIAPRRARSLRSRAGAGADIARARAACAPASRAQRQGRPKLLRMLAGGTPEDGGLVSLGSEEVGLGDEVDRGVGRLARIIAPRRVHCDVCAWRVSCVWSGVCCGGAVGVDLAWRLGEEGGTWAEIAPRTEAELEPRSAGRRPAVRRTSPERRRRVVMRWSEGAA